MTRDAPGVEAQGAAAPARGGVAVRVEGIALSYGTTPVLRDVDLVVEPGEFFALLGPSGSGKSTLLRIIAGFASPQRGALVIGADDMLHVPPWARNVGMVFQNYALWPHMSVARNVAFGLEERRLPKAIVQERVAAALELVGLADFAARRPGQLSGGQQQRVALARTIAIEPKVLLLDEPLSNLDAKLRVHMRQELRALQRKLGITTIFVTHDQEEALTTADRIAVMDQGVIQQVGTPMDLYDRPANRFVATFVGTINLVTGALRESAGGRVFVTAGMGEVALPPEAPLPAGTGPLELAFRPHAVRLYPPDAAVGAASLGAPGVVREREFLGEFVRYQIETGGVAITADQSHLAGQPVYPVGAPVGLAVDAREMRLVRA